MSATNVIRFTSRRQRPLVHLVDSPIAIKLLQEELLTAKQTYKVIAAKAQLASSTVSNIASGQTHWPRLETIIRLLSALGWRIVAEKQADEPDMG